MCVGCLSDHRQKHLGSDVSMCTPTKKKRATENSRTSNKMLFGGQKMMLGMTPRARFQCYKHKWAAVPLNTKARGIAPPSLRASVGCSFSVTLPLSSPAATRCGRSHRAAARLHTAPGRPRVQPHSSSELYTCKVKGPASPLTGIPSFAVPLK